MSGIPDVSTAYWSQHRDKARIDELRAHGAAFLENPPTHVRASTLGAITQAVRVLGEESDAIVRTWD